MNGIELIGLVGGAIGVSQALPQMRRIRRLGHGRGVSVGAWLLMFLVVSSWLGYGIRISSPAQYVTNAVAVVLYGLVVVALLDGRRHVWALLVVGATAVVAIMQVLPAAVVSVYLVTLAASRLPQVKKSWDHRRRGEESALSLQSLAVSVAALLCWEAWALLGSHWLVVVTTSLALGIVVTIGAIEWSGVRSRAAVASERA